MNSIIFYVFSLSAGMLLGRLSGFFREIYLARTVGANSVSDVLIVLITTPDLLINILVGGAFGMVLVPEFNKLGVIKAKILFNEALKIAFITFFLVSVVSIFISEYLILLFLPGLENEQLHKVLQYYSLSLSTIPLIACSGVAAAYLQYKNSFFLLSFGTVIFNLFIVIGLVISGYFGKQYLQFVTICLVLGAFFRFIFLWLFCKCPFMISKIFVFNYINTELLIRLLHCVMAGGVFYLVPIILRTFSSLYGESFLSKSNYAYKLLEFPIGVLITVFSIVFLTRLSKVFTLKKYTIFKQIASKLVFFVLSISLLVTFPLYFHSEKYINLFFKDSGLTNFDLIQISNYFSILVLSIPVQGLVNIFITIFNSQNKTKLPFVGSILTLIMAVIFMFHSPTVEILMYSILFSYTIACIYFIYFFLKNMEVKYFHIKQSLFSFCVCFLSFLIYFFGINPFHFLLFDMLIFSILFLLILYLFRDILYGKFDDQINVHN